MNLLAIIIVFFLMQHWRGARDIQQDQWLSAWQQWAGKLFARLKIPLEHSTILIILLPAVAVALVVYCFHSVLWGLFGLLLLVAVLLYTLGRGDFNAVIERYLDAWRGKDFQAAYQIAQEFSHGDILAKTDSLAELQRHSVQAMLYQGFERWFAVIFWFVLLGPFGALVYRTSFLLANENGIPDQYCNTMVCRIIYWLEWLPVRLFGISVAIVGDFGASVKVWRTLLAHDDIGTEERLMHYSLAALGENTQLACQECDQSSDEDALIIQGASQIERLRTLMNRTVVLSVVAVALAVIFV